MILDELNIIYSSDDNYCQHLGCSLYSLLEHNINFKTINIYIVSNGISKENLNNLISTTSGFGNALLHIIEFKSWCEKVTLNMAWPISISAYARLFVASMIPKNISRIIYLDCDMIIKESLLQLWNVDLNGYLIAAVQDTMPERFKKAVGICSEDLYFNSGMLLINLDEWRKWQIEQKIIEFINEKKGRVLHHDQGVLNGVLKGKWLRLPIKYNLMTIHYIFAYKKIKKYFND